MAVVGGDDREVVAELAERCGVGPHARDRLRSRRWHERLRAVRILGPALPVGALRQLQDDPSPEVRAAVLVRAAEVHHGEADDTVVDDLARALTDRDALVRHAAGWACVAFPEVGVDAAESALRRAVTESERSDVQRPPARVVALQVLAATATPDGAMSTLMALRDEDPLVRAAAIEAAVVCAPEVTAALALEEAAADEDPRVREAAAAAASGIPGATGVLEALGDDPDRRVRARVAQARIIPAGTYVPRGPVDHRGQVTAIREEG